MIEITAVGGYSEVGRNCTAIKVDDEIIIVDIGLHLENYVKLTEDEDAIKISPGQLIAVGAIPDVSILDSQKDKVKAIVISHAHLDHVGAVPYLANRFKAPIYGTPFTMEVLQTMLKDDQTKLQGDIKVVNTNAKTKITDNINLELIHITHSTPHTALVALHTKYGVILYANDFKLDMHPTLGKAPNFERLEQISKENILALICESTYADVASKTPSESVAKEMLKDVMFNVHNEDNLIIVTTFSSHIARLKSIVEFGKKLNRKVIFMGRSLAKYSSAAQNVGLIDFTKDVEVVKFSKQIEKRLKKIDSEREKYVLVVTGHQGEPKSVLQRIVTGYIQFKLLPDDNVIFSCKVIPTPINIANREALETDLKQRGVRIFKDIHQSGHAAREDLREFINIVKPRTIIPAHGTEHMTKALADLAIEMGYKQDSVFLLKNKQSVRVQ